MTRIATLDSLRGLALCGILAANAPTVLDLDAPPGDNPMRELLALTVHERFFPLFSLMFGISFGIIALGAAERGLPCRRVLAQRLGFLLLLGAGHQLLQPGEALLPYALAGLLVLLPSTWLPTWAVGVAGAALTVTGVVFDGGTFLVPGLVLLGYTAARAGLVRRLDAPRPWIPLLVAAGAGLAAAPLVGYLAARPEIHGFSPLSAGAGLLMATAYAGLLVAAMASPLRGVTRAVLEPFGRLALTNYVGATLILLALKPFADRFGIDGTSDGLLRMLGACAAILVVQWGLSRLWLTYLGQGPLERVWRWVTFAGIDRSPRPATEGNPAPALVSQSG